ncbi:hypothetical protein [Bifidobacterium adolescentis]|uniref:hypothetical protein n=1 Tax=Bifidobacterium adolescentis TaxID=1680 RepID=UPI0022E7FBB1|nr:hypothetical protein [Bifidobacterium adolescentis]
MSDNRNYSVITNFGCHWQCPYCIVRNTGIQIAETRMGATYDTVMDLADSGRLPVIKASQTEKYHESRKVRTTLTVYRLQCSRGHISTSWFSHAALASRQWKELVDEYKGKDTK